MVGCASGQRPSPEGLHAPRRVAARRQRQEEESEQDEPPELLPRRKSRPPRASRSPAAALHARSEARRWMVGRELLVAAPGVGGGFVV
jgi:hypothetical protein